MQKRDLFVLFSVTIAFVFLFGAHALIASAQTADSSNTSSNTSSDSVAAQRAEWEAELQQTEAEIAQWQGVLDQTKSNTASLQNDVATLTAKINQAKAFIQQKNIQIAQLDQSISQKNDTITSLEQQINDSDNSLGDLLRKTDELDNYSLAEFVLSKQNLSDFFADADSYAVINKSIEDDLAQIRTTKQLTEQQKEDLATQKSQQADLAATMQEQENQVKVNQQQKQSLIAENQTKEKSYQQIIADQEAKAAQIRAELFNLAGGNAAISFGDAYTYALAAQKSTGIDPAFLLAILTQESNLGANVGSCYVTDPTTGNGVSVTTGATKQRVMNPTRDVPDFLDILQQVGGSMSSARVSCWIPEYNSSGAPFGWGGAMGPAQFIPSTWELLASRVSAATGDSVANPWNPEDAFMASALYLSDLGGSGGGYTAERNAACKYYSGSSCSAASYAAGYGNSVMSKAKSIQENMIDPLNAATGN